MKSDSPTPLNVSTAVSANLLNLLAVQHLQGVEIFGGRLLRSSTDLVISGIIQHVQSNECNFLRRSFQVPQRPFTLRPLNCLAREGSSFAKRMMDLPRFLPSCRWCSVWIEEIESSAPPRLTDYRVITGGQCVQNIAELQRTQRVAD
jgi:hypothetical protein